MLNAGGTAGAATFSECLRTTCLVLLLLWVTLLLQLVGFFSAALGVELNKLALRRDLEDPEAEVSVELSWELEHPEESDAEESDPEESEELDEDEDEDEDEEQEESHSEPETELPLEADVQDESVWPESPISEAEDSTTGGRVSSLSFFESFACKDLMNSSSEPHCSLDTKSFGCSSSFWFQIFIGFSRWYDERDCMVVERFFIYCQQMGIFLVLSELSEGGGKFNRSYKMACVCIVLFNLYL